MRHVKTILIENRLFCSPLRNASIATQNRRGMRPGRSPVSNRKTPIFYAENATLQLPWTGEPAGFFRRRPRHLRIVPGVRFNARLRRLSFASSPKQANDDVRSSNRRLLRVFGLQRLGGGQPGSGFLFLNREGTYGFGYMRKIRLRRLASTSDVSEILRRRIDCPLSRRRTTE